MFRLQFLGSGSAFTVGDNFQSNVMITNLENNQRLLIDCGSDFRNSLYQLGLKVTDVNAVYISHLHADHTGGLECLAFSTYFNPKTKRSIKMFLSGDLKSELWDSTLKGGLESIEGKIVGMDDYFVVHSVPKNGTFEWEGITFQLVQVVHIVNGFSIVPSYGLIFELNGKKIFFSTDTQFSPAQLAHYFSSVDIIFHDCETTPFKSGVHTNYIDLKTLDVKHKSKMWLYHYNPGDKPDCTADGFLGWVQKHQIFE